MGNIGDGNGSSYPAVLDTQASPEYNSPNANKTLFRAAVPNDLASALIAVETTLGTNPQGSKADVKTFLQVEHHTDGTHGAITATNATFTTATIAGGTISNPTVTGTIGGSPALNNGITATTQAIGDNSTQVATTAFIGTADKVGQNSITSNVVIGTSETTIISTPSLSANRLAVGQVIRIVLDGTCSSSLGGNVGTFKVYFGGLIPDVSAQQVLSGSPGTGSAGSGTNIPFHVEILMTVRTAGLSASCIGNLMLINNGNTGITSSAYPQVVAMSASLFNALATGQLSVTYKGANTSTCTFNQALIEFVNL